MNRSFWFAAALAACSVSCARSAAVADFVPGEPMTFPLRSMGVLSDYGRLMLVNCRSRDATVEAAWTAMLQARIAYCQGSEPEIFPSKESYQAAARQFGGCIMPKPICAGVEVNSAEQCRKLAARG